MKKIKFISLTFILALSGLLAQAQGQGKNCPGPQNFDDEKIKAEKVAFITEKVNLTVKEAQAFWPIYNEFNDKMSVLFEEEHSLYRDIKHNFEDLTDEEMTKNIDRMIEISGEKAELESEYHQKYKEVLPITKIALLYQADKEFRKHLLHKYKGPVEE